MTIVSIGWITGFVIFFCAYFFQQSNKAFGFSICLIGTVLIGISTTLGDCTIIGFLKSLPPQLIGGWSSGTGMAGIFGTMTYLSFKTIGVEFRLVMLMFIPVAVLYFIIFKSILNMKAKRELKMIHKIEVVVTPSGNGVQEPEIEERQRNTEVIESQENESLSWDGVKAVFAASGIPIINLSAVGYPLIRFIS